jgi:hypothetical protein
MHVSPYPHHRTAGQRPRKEYVCGFETIANKFSDDWTRFNIVTLYGELSDQHYSFSYTEFSCCASFDLAKVAIEQYASVLIKEFDEQIKKKELRFKKKVLYDFGFLTEYIPECLMLLQSLREEVRFSSLRLSLSVKKNLKKFLKRKDHHHRKLSIRLNNKQVKALNAAFKHSDLLINVFDYIDVLPLEFLNKIEDLKMVKAKVIEKVYKYIAGYYENMRVQLIKRLNNPLFYVYDVEAFINVMVALVGSNYIGIDPTTQPSKESSYQQQKKLFDEVMAYFGISDRIYGKELKRIESAPVKTKKFFDQLKKNIPLPESKI